MEVNYENINPYDSKYDYFMRVEHLARYFFAADILKNCKNILDVASGLGYGTNILHNDNNVLGIDYKDEYLNIAKSNYPNVSFKKLDLNSNTITGSYDGIVSFETIEHLKKPYEFLKNLYDVLDNKGILILSFPNIKYEIIENGKNIDSYHIHTFNKDEMIKYLKDIGFKFNGIYGQSYINKIVNNVIKDYEISNLEEDATKLGYPNLVDIDDTYSYIFVLTKEV